MDGAKEINEDAGEASSDGEEDFESADEGETKEKSSRVLSVKNTKNVASGNLGVGKTSTEPSQASDETTCKNINEVENIASKLHDSPIQGDFIEPKQESGSGINTEEHSQFEGDVDRANIQLHVPKENTQGKECPAVVNEESLKTKIDVTKTSEDGKNTSSDSNEGARGGWSSWGSWGAVLNQATASVTSSLSHVIETVETSLGIPDPGELEEMEPKKEKDEVVTSEPKSIEMERGDECSGDDHQMENTGTDEFCDTDSFLSSWGLSSISNAVTSKGMELVTEGIDALETIGKKTMHVISEGDPGLRAKRNMFQKPSLSETLLEAKEKTTKEAAERKKQEVLETVNFNDEFDRYQGLAHLEALEILSKESEAKIESMLIDIFEGDLEQVKSKLWSIEIVFAKDSPEAEDAAEKELDGEFAVEIGNCAMALNLAFVPDKLNQTEAAVSKWLEECVKEQENEPNSRTTEEIYSHVVTSLANIAAKSIEVFRKVAEMILLMEEEDKAVSAEDRAVHLCKLTKVVTNRISSLSTSYAQCLNTVGGESEDSDNITPVITEVYLESSNSSSHVQDAFKLLLPVLQVSALNNFQKHSK